jgi:hypothetical protein
MLVQSFSFYARRGASLVGHYTPSEKGGEKSGIGWLVTEWVVVPRGHIGLG